MSLNPEVDGDIPALIGASAALSPGRHAVQRPDRRRQGRLQGRRVPAQPDRDRTEGFRARTRRRRHLQRRADGRIRSQGTVRRRDAGRGDVRPPRDAEGDQHDQRTGRRSRHQDVDWAAPAEERRADLRAQRSRRRPACRRLPGARQAAAPRRDLRRSRRTCMQAWPAAPKADGWSNGDLSKEFGELEYQTMRDAVLSTKVRIDGRALDTVRPISVARRHAAARARLVAVHPRRNAGDRRRHPRHRARRPDHRRRLGRVQGPLPVPLQLPALLGR